MASSDTGGHRDWERARNKASDFAKSPAEVDKLLDDILVRTRALIRQPAAWATIQGLGNALLEKRMLSGEQALLIMRSAWNSWHNRGGSQNPAADIASTMARSVYIVFEGVCRVLIGVQ